MNAQSSRKRPWRRDRSVPNPYRDSLAQEIGYRLDSRYAGCLLAVFAISLLAACGLVFLVYWLMH